MGSDIFKITSKKFSDVFDCFLLFFLFEQYFDWIFFLSTFFQFFDFVVDFLIFFSKMFCPGGGRRDFVFLHFVDLILGIFSIFCFNLIFCFG